MSDFDITVVGGGFVGLAFAIAASQYGYSVRVIDQKQKPEMPEDASSNVIAVNQASSQFLEELGVWAGVPERFKPAYKSMRVTDGSGTGEISFTAEEAGSPYLGHIVTQPALLAALAAKAEQVDGLTLCWGEDAQIEVGESSLLIGADGRHSRIREQLGIRQVGFPYGQTATVCLAQFVLDHEACAHQWFLEKGPLALLPLSEAGRVAIVWSSFDDLTALEESEFLKRLAEATEDRLGKIESVGPRFGFPLVQQHVLQYVAEGVALMGDAAHAIHPLAGQGANLGFADAQALASEIASARLEGLEPGSLKILRRYERARKIHNQTAAVAMEGFHRLFTAKLPAFGLFRSRGLDLVDGSAALKRLAIDLAAGR